MDFAFALTGVKSNKTTPSLLEQEKEQDVDTEETGSIDEPESEKKQSTTTKKFTNTKSNEKNNYSKKSNSSGFRKKRNKDSNRKKSGNQRVQRSDEYWETFRKAQDVLFQECILKPSEMEQIETNAHYMTDYRGETKWIKIRSPEHDIIKTGNDKDDMQFNKSKMLTSKSFRIKLEEYYANKLPNMYIKIFKSNRNNDVCIRLIPSRNY